MRSFLAILLALFAASAAMGEGAIVYVIPLTGEVEKGLFHVFQRGFKEAEDLKAVQIVIDMDTPGGRVDSAWEICDLILDSSIPVAVFVSGDATSAGAMIALAAEKIFMTRGSTIGTAAPVVMGPGTGESEMMDKKALSFVEAKFRSIAEIRGYDEEIVRAMVNPDVAVEKTGENGEKIVISEKGSLLTLTAPQAVRWGIAKAEVGSLEEALSHLGLADATVVRLQEAWSERIARFVTSMAVSGLLMTVGLLCIYLETRAPGFGLAGIVGILCLALFFWGHSLANLSGWEGPLLFVIGILLLGLEIFVTPGFGILGVSGIVAILLSFVITLVGRSPVTNPSYFYHSVDSGDVVHAMGVTIIAVGLATVGFMVTPFLFPAVAQTRLGRRLVLEESESRGEGYHSHQEAEDLRDWVGARGIAYTALRPAGIAVVNGRRVDVVSEGAFVNRDDPVEVVRVEGRRIVVKPV
ncbi:MAG TPA: NfeD family protein [bacterium]|nr:NfeD family protein [bacterium]HQL63980.1 NfeD family protein [bacterium]